MHAKSLMVIYDSRVVPTLDKFLANMTPGGYEI